MATFDMNNAKFSPRRIMRVYRDGVEMFNVVAVSVDADGNGIVVHHGSEPTRYCARFELYYTTGKITLEKVE